MRPGTGQVQPKLFPGPLDMFSLFSSPALCPHRSQLLLWLSASYLLMGQNENLAVSGVRDDG